MLACGIFRIFDNVQFKGTNEGGKCVFALKISVLRHLFFFSF